MPMPSLPKISIVMPVLNGGQTIENAIKSILAQNYPNIELLILDGGSTDNTIEVINKYKSYLSYWHSKRDSNPILAINEGARRATGDLVVQLMSDDFYEPETLHRVAQALTEHPDADIITCGGRIVFFDEKKKIYRARETYSTPAELDLNFHHICFGVSAICCRFIRKSLFEKIGYFIPADDQGKTMHSSDKEFLLRAVLHHAKNITIDYIGHNYLAHTGSTTYSSNRKMTVRLYVEHCQFAKMILNHPALTAEQRETMHYWYYHQSARLAFYYLYQCRFSEAWNIIRKDLPRYPFKWTVSFMTAAPDFIFRRVMQFCKKHINRFLGKDIVYGKNQ